MNILITGATGFVGSHLCELLIREGHNVFCLVRNEQKAKSFNLPGTYIKGSLSSSEENSWIDNLPSNLDAVIHTAGIVHSMNTKQFYNVNAFATQRLILDLKVKYHNLKFLLISSLAGAGPSLRGSKRVETDRPDPISDYGRSKKLAERFTKKLCPSSWNVSIIRPPMVIGPRDPAVLDIFKMIKGSFIVTAGLDGMKNEYSFVCVYDLIETIKRVLEQDRATPEVYFSSHPDIITTKDLYGEIQKQLSSKFLINLRVPTLLIRIIATIIGFLSKFMNIDIRLTPDKANELLANAWTCNSQKSIDSLNQNYKWNLEKTISATLEDYKKRDWL